LGLHANDIMDASTLAAPACLVRPGRPSDAGALAAFAAETFVDTYGRYNEPENLRRHLHAAFGPRQQAAELSDPHVATLLAHVGPALAGYAQVRRGAAPGCVAGAAPVELHRFYVQRRWHGLGVARTLLAEARAAAHAFGGRTLWLKVWERNARAIAFYAKQGLVDVGTADFFLGAERQTDRVLALDLGPPPSEDLSP
jgi:ribosomal protein S18 acetylase RimI-like enzyme